MILQFRCPSPFFLVSAAFALSAFAGAQTLEHRSAAPDPAPVKPAAAAPAEPALAKGTSLQVEISRHYPVKVGEPIEAHLMHPIYADGKLVVPQNTALQGRVIALQADTKTRWHARLRGDFTPFHTVQVQFDRLELPSGTVPHLCCSGRQWRAGASTQAPGVSPKQSFIARRWAEAKANMHDRIAYFTAPGKGDRALQLLYHQLPYHPERIDANTAWSFELTAPVDLPENTAAYARTCATASVSGKSEVWAVNATLSHDLTSATAKPGDPVEALVVEPVYDKRQATRRSPGLEAHRQSRSRQGSPLLGTQRKTALHLPAGPVPRGLSTAKWKARSPVPPPRKLRISRSMPKAPSRRVTSPALLRPCC